MHTQFQWAFSFFFLFAFCTTSPALGVDVISISITSSSSGLGGFEGKSEFQIRKTPDGYTGKLTIVDIENNFNALIEKGLLIKKQDSKYEGDTWTANTEVITPEEVVHRLKNDVREFPNISIPDRQIELFIKGLNTPPMTNLKISQFKIDRDWLRKVARELIDEMIKPTDNDYLLLNSRRSQFFEKLSDLDKAHKGISSYYSSVRWSDDYPEFKSVITFSDGHTIHLASNSQKEYMIPWNIKNGSNEFKTYDITLSKALNNLIPDNFSNKNRIEGNLNKVFKEQIWSSEIRSFIYGEEGLGLEDEAR